jgi:hypothetical protein
MMQQSRLTLLSLIGTSYLLLVGCGQQQLSQELRLKDKTSQTKSISSLKLASSHLSNININIEQGSGYQTWTELIGNYSQYQGFIGKLTNLKSLRIDCADDEVKTSQLID